MADHSSNGILEEINRLILDTTVTVERAQDLAKSVRSGSSVPSPIPESAFFELLLDVVTRFRNMVAGEPQLQAINYQWT
jgi:hypothetical protein